MKKIFITLVFVFVFSIFVFADGQMGNGKSCSGNCLVSSINNNNNPETKNTIHEFVSAFIKSLLDLTN